MARRSLQRHTTQHDLLMRQVVCRVAIAARLSVLRTTRRTKYNPAERAHTDHPICNGNALRGAVRRSAQIEASGTVRNFV